jgi:hypothetical protein
MHLYDWQKQCYHVQKSWKRAEITLGMEKLVK